MLSVESFALFFAVIFIASVIAGKRKRNNGLPAGPNGYPVFGNLLQLGSIPHLQIHQWAEGKMYTIYFLQTPVLVLNDANLIRKLFGMMPATGRYDIGILTSLMRGQYGIGNSDGTVWLEQKQFFVKVLKQCGFGRGEKLETKVLDSVQELSQWIQNEQNISGNVKLYQNLPRCTNNLMWTMVTGKKSTHRESEFLELLDEFLLHIQTTTKAGLTFFPSLKYIAPKLTGYTDFCEFQCKLHKCVDEFLKTHSTSREVGNVPENIIHAYMEQAEMCEDPKSSFYGEEGSKHMFASLISLFLAGGDSTNVAVNWGIFYLTVNKNAQEKLHEEIEKVIGNKRNPTLADRMHMPYMESVIHETLRLSTTTPMGMMHKLTDAVQFEGYHLPKGMLLMADIYHVHYDKNVWKDPENFRPERFLEDGNNLKEYVVAFQPGKRSCPGESQAKDIMFLFITKLIQQFRFLVDKSVKNPKEYLEPVYGFALLPPKLPVMVIKRI